MPWLETQADRLAAVHLRLEHVCSTVVVRADPRDVTSTAWSAPVYLFTEIETEKTSRCYFARYEVLLLARLQVFYS